MPHNARPNKRGVFVVAPSFSCLGMVDAPGLALQGSSPSVFLSPNTCSYPGPSHHPRSPRPLHWCPCFRSPIRRPSGHTLTDPVTPLLKSFQQLPVTPRISSKLLTLHYRTRHDLRRPLRHNLLPPLPPCPLPSSHPGPAGASNTPHPSLRQGLCTGHSSTWSTLSLTLC